MLIPPAQLTPPTLVLRHHRENLKKCSLRGLEERSDFCFLKYPSNQIPDLSNYVLLAIDGEPLCADDSAYGLFLLDATWRYTIKMRAFVEKAAGQSIKTRRIPGEFRTAYPRYQTECSDPDAGLASIEALYVAYKITGRDPSGLLDNYHWKEAFLEKNGINIVPH